MCNISATDLQQKGTKNCMFVADRKCFLNLVQICSRKMIFGTKIQQRNMEKKCIIGYRYNMPLRC